MTGSSHRLGGPTVVMPSDMGLRKDDGRTPNRRAVTQALPLNDVTASYVNAFPPYQASVNRSSGPPSGSRTVLRQLSLSDAFGLSLLGDNGNNREISPPSSPVSPPRHSLFTSASSDGTGGSSPCPFSPVPNEHRFSDVKAKSVSPSDDLLRDEEVHDENDIHDQLEKEQKVEADIDSNDNDNGLLGVGRPIKRRRSGTITTHPEWSSCTKTVLAPSSVSSESSWSKKDSTTRKIKSLFIIPGKQISGYAMLQQRAMGCRAGPRQVSMHPYLRAFASDNWEQVHRFESTGPSDRHWAPPFTVAFSHGAKAGGTSTLAVATEEGSVFMFDASTAKQDAEEKRTTFKAHNNAIFDIAWSKDDSIIATASGDSCVKLWDVEKQRCIGFLGEHACTVRSVVWSPHNPSLLSTASRDGSIRVWDRRIPGEPFQEIPGANTASVPDGTCSIASVNCIRNAHGKGKHVKGNSATKSVTAVAFLHHSSHLLASSGSSDSVIRIWDLRKSHDWRVNPVSIESNAEAVSHMHPVRQHGISNMKVSPDGRKIYAINTNASIHAYDALNITQKMPLATYVHPQVVCGSFYIHIALSPCSRFLASGSTDGAVYLWDTEGTGRDAVRLLGHEKESTGVDWAGEGMLTSCSDDSLVRIWTHSPRNLDARTKDANASVCTAD